MSKKMFGSIFCFTKGALNLAPHSPAPLLSIHGFYSPLPPPQLLPLLGVAHLPKICHRVRLHIAAVCNSESQQANNNLGLPSFSMFLPLFQAPSPSSYTGFRGFPACWSDIPSFVLPICCPCMLSYKPPVPSVSFFAKDPAQSSSSALRDSLFRHSFCQISHTSAKRVAPLSPCKLHVSEIISANWLWCSRQRL